VSASRAREESAVPVRSIHRVPPLGLLLALALATLLSVASTARAGEVTPGCVEDPATEHVTLHSNVAPQLGAQYIAALVDPGAALAAPRSWASRPAPERAHASVCGHARPQPV
jgi:hypothetical protein